MKVARTKKRTCLSKIGRTFTRGPADEWSWPKMFGKRCATLFNCIICVHILLVSIWCTVESECIQCTAQHHRDVMQRVDYVSFSPFNPWYIVDIFKGCYAIARRCERTAIIITTTSIVLNCVSARILCPRGDKIIRNYDVIWFATDTLYYIVRLVFEKRKKNSNLSFSALQCTAPAGGTI